MVLEVRCPKIKVMEGLCSFQRLRGRMSSKPLKAASGCWQFSACLGFQMHCSHLYLCPHSALSSVSPCFLLFCLVLNSFVQIWYV